MPKYKKEYDSNWEPEVAKLPVVISFPGTELKSRDVVVGLTNAGASRAYPWDTLVKQSPVMDHVGGTPLLVAVGPDGKSFRVFVSRVDGKDSRVLSEGRSRERSASRAHCKCTCRDQNRDSRHIQGRYRAGQRARSPTVPKTWLLLDTHHSQ